MHRRPFTSTLSLAFVVSMLASPESASADIVFDGFQQTTGLTLNGSTTTPTTSDGHVLRLTPAQSFRTGSAFSTIPVSTEVFTSVFSFRMTNPGGWTDTTGANGADGLAFVVQNVANDVGSSGGGLGYNGISPSIAVEFDTFHNPNFNDPSRSHVAIDLNGSVTHNAANGPTANVSSPELGSGDRWWSWVIYDGTTLSAYLLQSESATEPQMPTSPLLTHDIDLDAMLGASTAFAGLTSATGNAWENHDVIYWRYTEAVPEPASIALLALGGIPWLCRRCSQRVM